MPVHSKRLSRSFFDYLTLKPSGNSAPLGPTTTPTPAQDETLPQTATMTSIASPTSTLPPDPAAMAKSRANRRSSRSGDAQLQPDLAAAAAPAPPSGRRKSQSHMSNPARALPYPASKPARRPSQHSHSQSAATGPTDRRGSLPSLHLRSSSQRNAEPVPSLPGLSYDGSTAENPTSDYSSLQSFTFGVASGSTDRSTTYDADSLSPLANDLPHEDRTPRPSIFRARDDDPNDQDEQERCQRAKMRAIDYGERRPSLPTNLNLSAAAAHDESEGELEHELEPSTPMPGPSMTPPPDANQTPERTSLSDVELDVAIDTDIDEYSSETEPDSASVHTFGMGASRFPRSEHVTPWEFQQLPSSHLHADEDVPPHVQSRRGSVQTSMHTVQPGWGWDPDARDTSRDREDSVATLRRPSDAAADGLQSMRIQSPQPEAGSSASPYEGLNLEYIIGDMGQQGVSPGSRRSSLSFVNQPLSPPPPKGKKGKGKEKGKAKDKSQDIQEYLGQDASIAPWANPDSRRPSQATISGDDSFSRALRNLDPEFPTRRLGWSFFRQGDPEPANGTSPSGRRIKWTSVSRCAQTGILRSERSVMVSSEQSRRPAERLNVYHVQDPSSEGNTLGGPGMLVHKHSRAKAFAMYRFYELHARRNAPVRSVRSSSVTAAPSVASGQSRAHRQGSTHGQASLPPSKGILLAPKSVMTQFTNTHSTRNLEDHGLLAEPRPSSSRQRVQDDRRTRSASRDRPRERTHSGRLPDRPPLPFKEPKPHRQHIIDPKALPEIIEQSNAINTVSTTSSGEGTTASIASSSTPLVRQQQPQIPDEIIPITVAPPNTHSRGSSVTGSGDDEDEGDEDEDGRRNRRTTHAEAYSTLDQPTLERLRQGGLDDKSRNSSWLLKPFRSQPASRAQAGGTSIVSARPPWLTLAPRGQQEEQAHAIKHLNSSFVDVGLLPSYRKKASAGVGVGRQGAGKHAEALKSVPDDALCMLLPLWPTETDPTTMQMYPNERAHEPPLEERLYLLVYFVRFVDRAKEGHGKDASGGGAKKRPRADERERQRDHRERDTSATVVFNCFRAIARLMSYDDLKGSNVRLPVHGLSVTGSLAEARRGIPPSSLRNDHKDDFIIAICADRTNGIVELFPDGLDKLGLCVRDPTYVRPTADEMQRERNPEEEPALPLTAIGRAAVEMTWLACMSLTSFGDV